MYLWLSAEETYRIGDVARRASNAFEERVNLCLKQIEVGEWKKWRVILIMLPDEMRKRFPENRRLTRRDMSLDFRVAIDYHAAINADFGEHIDLIVNALEKTMQYFNKARISEASQDLILSCIRTSAEQVKAEQSHKH